MVDTQTTSARAGSARTRDLGALRVTDLSVGSLDNNAYLLECVATGQRLLVDAAAEPESLLALLGDGGLGQVFTTHFHYDHWGALREVVEATGAATLAHPADAPGIPIATGTKVRGGDVVRVGDVALRAVHLVGHTAGSLALVHAGTDGRHYIWSGDTLFPGGVGATHGEPALFASLYRDVVDKIFDVYADDTEILPGHGVPTTVGAERPALLEWERRGW